MPRFSLITILAGPSLSALERCARSVRRQHCSDWEWQIVVNGSVGSHVRQFLRKTAIDDDRIRVVFRENCVNPVAVRNEALAVVSGDFVAFVDGDDQFERDALARFAEVIDEVVDVDFIYSDKLVLDLDRAVYRRAYKPAWSPERLRCQFYTGRLATYRRVVVEQIGGFREQFEGAEEYDLALRVGEVAREVRHVTSALYRRNDMESLRSDVAVRAVRDHCERVGIPFDDVEPGDQPGTIRIRRQVVGEPLVSVIIPSSGTTPAARGVLRSTLESVVEDLVQRTSYRNLEVVIVPDPDTPQEVIDRCRALDPERVVVLPPVPKPFNYSIKVNVGAASARGDMYLFLNDDVEVIHEDWLEPMVAIAQQSDVGAVGALLFFEDETIQHGGTYLYGGPGHAGFRLMSGAVDDRSLYAVDRESSAVTGACMLVPADVYDDVGGHTLILPSNWDDVDLCLKIVTSGRRVVWTPQARLFHFESMSRDPSVQDFEVLRFWARWAEEIMADPFFVPPLGPHGYAWPADRFR